MTLMASTALWAMHPDYLAAMLRRDCVDAIVPEALKAFASLGGKQAATPADPVRDGATVIIPVVGVLAPRGVYYGAGTYLDVFAERVREYGADPKIGTVILDIRSPGGTVFGTREAADAVFDVRQMKPVIAVANPFAFSAAHWIATQASAFYASSSGEVGSVGVRGGHTDISGLEDKIGMKTTLLGSHPDKIAGHPYAPLNDDDRAEMQAQIDESAAEFNSAIARGRGMAIGEVAAVHGTGGTFSARRAAAAGVIDGVMTLRDVVVKYGSSRARLVLMRRQAAASALAASI